MFKITLTVQSPEGDRHVPVTGDCLTIGRNKGVDLHVDDRGLSRIHASVRRDEETVWFLDEGSRNGSLVNGEPVGADGRVLADGDEIRIGDGTTIVVSIGHSRGGARDGRSAHAGALPRWPLAAALVLTAVAIGGAAFASRLAEDGERPDAARTARDPYRAGQASIPRPPGAESSADRVATATPESAPPPPASEQPPAPDPPVEAGSEPEQIRPRRLYQQMSEQEQVDFVRREARHISMMMGKRPYEFTDEVTLIIKKYLDGYARRANSKVSGTTWGDGLPALYGRASRYAPLINRAFRARGMHPVVGLYIAMIETEYHECLVSPVGAKGMFQFMPATAAFYGVSPENRCDVELMAPVCAHYMADRLAQFGGDSLSVALAIASYNRGEAGIASDLHKVLGSGNPERSFWTLVENAEKLPPGFQNENIKYVPKFFAAAIVGENPWAFGLRMQPLSSITDDAGGSRASETAL